MDKFSVNRNKNRGLTREQLLELTKEVNGICFYESETRALADRILKLEAHNLQLRNILAKSTGTPKEKVSNSSKKNRPFDFSKYYKRSVLLRICYFGWDYQGLAVQEDSSETIEAHIFNALIKSCLIETRETSNYHRCGRTDKGVSSFGQVLSIQLRSKFPPDLQNSEGNIEEEFPYCKILNALLPDDIRILSWLPLPQDKAEYSARFDCNLRTYKYYFPRANLDLSAMRLACAMLPGSHDFRNLCKMDVGNGVTAFIRKVEEADILPVSSIESTKGYEMYYLKISGNAFLWHQIRCIMGILLLIGEGNEKPEIIKQLMDVENCPRKPQYNMALDVPLNLFECRYELTKEIDWAWDLDELNAIIATLQAKWTLGSVRATMIRDVLEDLEKQYQNVKRINKKNNKMEDTVDICTKNLAQCLLQGVKPRVYKLLLERNTCSSLEERIKHYVKKRRIEAPGVSTEEITEESL